MRIQTFLPFFLLLFPLILSATSIQGVVQDASTKTPMEGVIISVQGSDRTAVTDNLGIFRLENLAEGRVSLIISTENYTPLAQEVLLEGNDVDLGVLLLKPAATDIVDDIPTITLNDEELVDNDVALSDNISGLLSASRDPFVSEASYTFGSYRFRIRGYDSENTTLMLNGVSMNELENGRLYWSTWGGLNDVFRNRQTSVGMDAMEYTFGGLGGGTAIDTRAASQRKQKRFSYAISNRSYRNRIMGTWSTGMLKNGWAFSFSGSRRWGQEGFIEGTSYDAWAYFASIDRKLNDKHSLNFTFFGAPTKRGRSSGAIQELYDLAGTNYYNSYWGYQDGEKRNSRINKTHQPVSILRHDWTISENTNLTTAISYQTGQNGGTRLDWRDAPDPRPDYYRYLPSYVARENEEAAQELQDYLTNTEGALQLDWDAMYKANTNAVETIENVGGTGQNVTGHWAQYIIESQQYDSDELNLQTTMRHAFSDNFTLNGGASYQQYVGHNYKKVEDLLGADFTVNLDNFAERENVADIETFRQNDLDNPNRLVREGDIFGWNYNSNINKTGGWLQGVFTSKRVDAFAALDVNSTTFWREGLYRNGRFPESSLGESEKQNYLNYGAKAGATFKINGRNYLYANAGYLTRAPYFRNAYTSPRTRNQIVPNLTEEKVSSIEGGYLLRSPSFKGRLTGYATRFEDGTRIIRYYDDFRRSFGSLVIQNIDRQHVGIEAALEAKISARLSITGVAAIGQYITTSRQQGTFFLDNDENTDLFEGDEFTIYSKNFFFANGPQTAYTGKLSYQGKKYWFAHLNFNYFDNIWLDFAPTRRSETAVFGTEGEVLDNIITQEQAPAQYTVDFFGGKSFRFGDQFLYFNVGISNLLNNQEFVTGGFEQLRFDFIERDPNSFPPRKYYAYGRTYFVSLAYRF